MKAPKHVHALLVAVWIVAVSLTTCSAQEDGATDVNGAPNTGEESSDNAGPDNGPNYAWARTIGRVLGMAVGDEQYYSGMYEDEVSPLLGSPAPEIELAATDGQTFKLSEHRGEIVVLDFWATWCGPCVMAMPKLQELHEGLHEQGVVVVGVNQGDSHEDVTALLAKKGVTFTQVLDTEAEASDRYGVVSLPTTVVIDQQGVIQMVHAGFTPGLDDTLRDAITRLEQGETLYDAEAVAAVREQRRERVAKAQEVFGPVRPERLEEVSFLPLCDEAYFDNGLGDGPVTLPDSGEQAVALCLGKNRLALVPCDGDEPTVTRLEWKEAASEEEDYDEIAAFSPLSGGEGLQWVVAKYAYNEDWDTEAIHLGLFDPDGENVWIRPLGCLGDYPNLSLAVGDLDGDDSPEIATLAEHYGAFTETGGEDYLHVLSVYDQTGELLSRVWIDGDDGRAIYILPHQDGGRVLVNVREGAALYRLLPAQE